MEREKTNNEINMLQGNINRMCVCSDLKEFNEMYEYAQKRLETIYKINRLRLTYLMERVDCDKCIHGYYEEDKLRCRSPFCNPKYEDDW